MRTNHLILTRAAACVATLSAASASHAALMNDGTTREQMVAAANYMQGFVVSIQYAFDGEVINYRLTGTLYDSTHVIVCGHQFSNGEPTPVAVYATGPGINWRTNPGTGVSVSKIEAFPGFDDRFPPTTVDLMMITLAQPLSMAINTSGPISPAPLTTRGAKTIADVQASQHVWSAGFGYWGTPNSGSNLSDGVPGGYQAPVDGFGLGAPVQPVDAVKPYYFEGSFLNDGGASFGALNGKGLGFDSGSPAVDADGHLVGIATYQSGGWEGSGYTGFVRLGHPDIRAWIATNVTPGDLDADSTLDADDLDLVLRMTPGSVSNFKSAFDLDKNGQFAANPTAATSDAAHWLAQLKHTVFGDADLSGAVSFDDLLVVAQHYGDSANTLGWAAGNFDGTAGVGFDDLLILAQHYGEGGSIVDTLPANVAADWTLARSFVPEPVSLVSAAAAIALTARRR